MPTAVHGQLSTERQNEGFRLRLPPSGPSPPSSMPLPYSEHPFCPERPARVNVTVSLLGLLRVRVRRTNEGGPASRMTGERSEWGVLGGRNAARALSNHLAGHDAREESTPTDQCRTCFCGVETCSLVGRSSRVHGSLIALIAEPSSGPIPRNDSESFDPSMDGASSVSHVAGLLPTTHSLSFTHSHTHAHTHTHTRALRRSLPRRRTLCSLHGPMQLACAVNHFPTG